VAKDISEGMTLYTWDVFKILLDYEVNRSRRYPSPLSLIDISLESNPISPEAIEAAETKIASLLNSHLRSADIPAHFNHDYFVLLPTTNESGGRAVCERLLSVFKTDLLTEQEGAFPSLSAYMGLATNLGGPDLSAEILIQQAGSALKHALAESSKNYVSYSELK
jgi:hypothetical protein